MSRDELIRRSRATLAGIRARCNADPGRNPFAERIQRLRQRRRAGLPLYDPGILQEALKVHDDLEPARKAANEVALPDE